MKAMAKLKKWKKSRTFRVFPKGRISEKVEKLPMFSQRRNREEKVENTSSFSRTLQYIYTVIIINIIISRYIARQGLIKVLKMTVKSKRNFPD
ncbi:hypothetical protein J2S01_000185 [Pectinatus haikarae]|uniref:Uncharacterized protein n=1 Tax=Pectinatus haikarae TaxID=349096 RepID=A0ABT9Y4R8_9FIRM|nr:hypothetical protein [Pectinatus haikarae]